MRADVGWPRTHLTNTHTHTHTVRWASNDGRCRPATYSSDTHTHTNTQSGGHQTRADVGWPRTHLTNTNTQSNERQMTSRTHLTNTHTVK